MAQFYAEIKGNKGVATRQGSKSSGLTAHIRGYDVGVKVFCEHRDGQDIITVWRTGGSNNPAIKDIICEIDDSDK